MIRAVTTIQSCYRGFKTRKHMQSQTTIIERSSSTKLVKMDNVEDIDVLRAVTAIQSCYRGFKTRKSLKKTTAADDIFVDGLDVIRAVTKIQSCYRGFKTRRQLIVNEKTTLMPPFEGTQHTGEFHDSIPLPLLDVKNLKLSEDANNQLKNYLYKDKVEFSAAGSSSQSNSNFKLSPFVHLEINPQFGQIIGSFLVQQDPLFDFEQSSEKGVVIEEISNNLDEGSSSESNKK